MKNLPVFTCFVILLLALIAAGAGLYAILGKDPSPFAQACIVWTLFGLTCAGLFWLLAKK